MKYRILPTKSKTNPFKLIKDPDGENKTIGNYKSSAAAIAKLNSLVDGV